MKSPISGPAKIRHVNRRAVLSHIRHHGKNSRSKIGKELGLSPAAMTSVVSELIEERLLRKSQETSKDISKKESKVQGRPTTTLELNPNKAYVYGLLLRPIGDTCYIEIAWSDYTGVVSTFDKIFQTKTGQLDSIIDGILKAISTLQEVLNNKLNSAPPIKGLCIGIPGVVENKTIPIAPKLTCIEGSEFITKLEKYFPYPVTFENDVNLGAMSELHQQPRLRKLSFAYLHVYSGVGSSIVLEGKLLKGSRGWAGEIGQLDIKYPESPRPTFEQLLSVDVVLGDQLEALGHPRDALDLLANYIDDKHEDVLKTCEKYSYQLFDAINVIHSVLDLDEIMIDFPSTKLFNKFLPTINKLINGMQHKLVISTPAIGHQADLHGAALNALSSALERIEQRKL